MNKPAPEEAPPMPKLERTDTLQPIEDPTEEQVANYLLKLKSKKQWLKEKK